MEKRLNICHKRLKLLKMLLLLPATDIYDLPAVDRAESSDKENDTRIGKMSVGTVTKLLMNEIHVSPGEMHC